MLRIWGQPLSNNLLQQLATPQAGDLESFPDIKYDRQTFPQAGGVASLKFFNAIGGGPNVTNMEAAGQFPAPQWFQLFAICITPMTAGPSNITETASGTNQTGINNDWDLLTKTQGAVINFTISRKAYGPWPVLACHGLGGAFGVIVNGGGSTGQQTVANGPADGGFGPQGEVVIPPNVGFTCDIQLAAAQALSVATLVEVALIGRIYRAPR